MGEEEESARREHAVLTLLRIAESGLWVAVLPVAQGGENGT
jgi:hypothetical protein